MKVVIDHILERISPKPNIDDLSDKLFQLGHEHDIVENNILDIEITPNRGDCLSLIGILRDLGCFYDVDLNFKTFNEPIKEFSLDFICNAPDACKNISFLKIDIDSMSNKYKGPLNDYFSDMDIKKNNFFTDISNYIAYETGQPTHCYDAQKLNQEIVLDYENKTIPFMTLLDKEIKLEGKNLVFKQNDQIINLAGVIGGKSTCCSQDTKSVVVECAYFNPESIIGKSIKYDVKSDAAHKFERGVDPSNQEKVLRRFIKIVEENADISNIELFSKVNEENKNILIDCDYKSINKILGLDLSLEDITSYLAKLGINYKNKMVTVPQHRSDIRSKNDIAEEIARIIGYNNIQNQLFELPEHNNKSGTDLENKIKNLLVDKGFTEVINDPFVKDETNNSIVVDNPLDSNRKYLRTSLKKSLMNNLIYNERRQKDSIKLFEISDIYSSNERISSRKMLGIIGTGRLDKNYKDFSKKIDNSFIAAVLGDYVQKASISYDEISRQQLNIKGKNPIIYSEFEISLFNKNILEYKPKISRADKFISYNPISEFPSSTRDLSFSLESIDELKTLENLILNYKNQYLKDVFVFDFYHNDKNGQTKIGFRFVFQSNVSTLTDSEINQILELVIEDSLIIKGVDLPGRP